MIKDVEDKGRGVFALEMIPKGGYVLEYKTSEVYKRREMKKKVEEYKTNDEGSYILEAQTKDGWWCFDATRRFNSFGRLLNHSHTAPNVRMHKPMLVRGKWRVGFLALMTIKPGEELVWDYGCPPEGHQWLYKRTGSKCVYVFAYVCVLIQVLNYHLGLSSPIPKETASTPSKPSPTHGTQ